MASILAPLAAFLRGDAAQRLHDQARAQISRVIVPLLVMDLHSITTASAAAKESNRSADGTPA